MPSSMFGEFRDKYGVDIIHGWGMTETSPIVTLNQLKSKHIKLSQEEQGKVHLAQGRPVFGTKMRLVGEEGGELPKDGQTPGNLQVRGHWVVDTYFGAEVSALSEEGWFDTGDVATIDPDGYMIIRDRSKDIIKSGGEWISTVELENIGISHPAEKTQLLLPRAIQNGTNAR